MTGTMALARRRMRYELYSLATVLALALSLAFIFPYDALRFNAVAASERSPASCAFVTLTAAEERGILESARRAWAVNPEGERNLRADLTLDDIPDEEPGAIADIADRLLCPPPGGVTYDAAPLPKTLAAPAPEKIAPAAAPVTPEDILPFSPKELLQLD